MKFSVVASLFHIYFSVRFLSFFAGLLELTYATFAPGDEMPDWLMKPRENRAITWQELHVQEQAEKDKW